MLRPVYRRYRTAALCASLCLMLLACGPCAPEGELDLYDRAVWETDRPRADRKSDPLRKPAEVLRFSGLQPGMLVVDLMGGGGYYSEIMSHVVGPEGKVILQNNSLFLRFAADDADRRLQNNRLPNVERLDSQFADFKLPQNVDFMLMGLCYHDIYIKREDPVRTTSREEFFPQVWNSLRPGARVLVIDHAARPGSGIETTKALHRIDEEFAVRDFEEVGFRLLGRLNILRNPEDDHTLRMRADGIEGRTDRFILLFEKPLESD